MCVTHVFPAGSRIRRLPREFERCSRLLVTTWGHDPSEIPVSGALTMLLDALQHASVLVQAIATGNNGGIGTAPAAATGASESGEARTKTMPFPPPRDNGEIGSLDLKTIC